MNQGRDKWDPNEETADRRPLRVDVVVGAVERRQDLRRAAVRCLEHATNLEEDIVETMIEKGVWVVPNFYGVSISQNPPDFLNPVQAAKLKQIGANGKRSYEMIVKAGKRIKVGFGTDQLGGPADQAKQLLEFAARAEFYPAAEVLRQATAANGEMLAMSGVRNPFVGVAWAATDRSLRPRRSTAAASRSASSTCPGEADDEP